MKENKKSSENFYIGLSDLSKYNNPTDKSWEEYYQFREKLEIDEKRYISNLVSRLHIDNRYKEELFNFYQRKIKRDMEESCEY